MSKNSENMKAELSQLGYRPENFFAHKDQGGAEGVCFNYKICDGSRIGQFVTLGIALHEKEGEWPEVAPHWLYISPPDIALAEQVKGGQNLGAVEIFQCPDWYNWMVISAPPSDFWDQIDTPNGKNMQTYLEMHIRRIWKSR